jgi:hypothetical protein
MQRFWVFDFIALLDKDTYNNADKAAIDVNTTLWEANDSEILFWLLIA